MTTSRIYRRLHSLLVIGCALPALFAAADISPYLKEGKGLEAEKKYAEAAAAYSRALDLEPNDATALSLRAWARHLAGDRPGARADFDRCLAVRPDYDGARYQRSLMHAAAKDFAAAIADLEELARRDPQNARYPYDLARACQRAGKPAAALAAAETMLRLAPNNVNSWALRSMLREKSGDPAGALADTEKALALAKDEKTAAMYAKDRDRLRPLAAAAMEKKAADPASMMAAAPSAPAPARPAAAAAAAATSPAAGPAWVPLDLHALSTAQYNGAVAVAVEGLRNVYAPMSAADTVTFEKKWAPRFSKPSPETATYLNKLVPLVQEFLALRNLLGESAAAYDRALEEARFAAGYGSDRGVGAAMAEAGRCKTVLEDGRQRLQNLVAQIGALGDPPDATMAQKRQRKRHTDAIRTARRAGGLADVPLYLRVEFPDLPEGWVVNIPNTRDPKTVRGPSLRSQPREAAPPIKPIVDYSFRPPADERVAYLRSGNSSLAFIYCGTDLFELAETIVRVRFVEGQIANLDDAIRISGLRDLFDPTKPQYGADRLPKPSARESTFNGTPAYLIEGHWFGAPISGGFQGFNRVYLMPSEGGTNSWIEVDVRVECPYYRYLTPPDGSPWQSDYAAKRRACAARIEHRLDALFDTWFFNCLETLPEGESARLDTLTDYAVTHAVDWSFRFTTMGADYAPWHAGRWKVHPEATYNGSGGLPPEQRAPRPAGLSGNSMRLTSNGGKTAFVHSWTPLPDEIKPGPLELSLTSANTQHTTDKNGDIVDDTSSFEIVFHSTDGRGSTDKAHADPKRGPTKTSGKLSTVIKGGKEWSDVAYVTLYFDGAVREEVQHGYDWVWDVPPDNPAIPPFYFGQVAANAPRPPTAEELKRAELEKKAKQERIAEIRENLSFLDKCLAAERAEQARATDATRRADYQFRILGLESDILAEQDLIKSLETGLNVHTRSPFEQYAAATFEQQCRAEAQAASLTLRAVESANRLAALLPDDEAAKARAFLARQFTPKALAEHDVAKIRQVVTAVSDQVGGYWQSQAATAEGAAAVADFAHNAASNIKTAADSSMSACSLFGGGSINLIYQAGTGYAEGGFKQAAKNALTTWSDAADYGFTAYDAYQEGGAKGAAQALALKYAQGQAMQYIAGKLLADAGHGVSTTDPAPRRKPSLQEQFDAAKFKQEREWGEALVKDFQKTQADLLKAGGGGAAPDIILKLQAAARDKATAVASSLHAKNYLKYVADTHVGRAYDTHMRAVHTESDALLKQKMKDSGWNADEWDLVEFRNAASLGKPNMDRDVGLREIPRFQADASGKLHPTSQLTKDGKPMSLDTWREEAQKFYNQSYRTASGGRSAEIAMEGITTSTHPEAYKDLLWLGNDRSAVSKAWAGQAADVTRYKANHLLARGDPSVSYFTKLQEVARGTAKDMDTKLLPLLAAAKPAAAATTGLHAQSSVSADALLLARGHWAEVHQTLQAFGRNDIDPLTATRRIRELTGGKSIPEVVDDMATLMESLVKGGRR